jgi:hypothetical protein
MHVRLKLCLAICLEPHKPYDEEIPNFHRISVTARGCRRWGLPDPQKFFGHHFWGSARNFRPNMAKSKQRAMPELLSKQCVAWRHSHAPAMSDSI